MSFVERLGRFGVLSSLIVVTGCSGKPAFPALDAFRDPEDAPAAIRKAAEGVVKIATSGGYATGVFVSDGGLLVTNNHVLGTEMCPREGCYFTLSFDYQHGGSYQAPVKVFGQPLHVDPGLDMAVLQVYSLDSSGDRADALATPKYVTMAPTSGSSLVGKHLHVVGHPEGHLKKWSEGEGIDVEGSWLRCSAHSLPGNSGSPVLNDSGEMVGILHRASASPDIVTRDGDEDAISLITPSEQLEAAMQADLPASVLSVRGVKTTDFLVNNEQLFRNAHVSSAEIDGGTTEVLATLGTACDTALTVTTFSSPDDLAAQLAPCSASMSWIACSSSDSSGSWSVCPEGADADAWRSRYALMNERLRAFDGHVWLDAVSFGPEALEKDAVAGMAVGKASLLQALDEAQVPLEWPIVPYLAAHGVTSYDGTDLVEFIDHYAESTPEYADFVSEIVYSAEWMNALRYLGTPRLKAILDRLSGEADLSLGGALLVEDARYQLGMDP